MAYRPVHRLIMKRLSHFPILLLLLLLLCGFFWNDPTWQQVDASIDRKYPTVESININSLKTSLDQGKHFILIDVREKDEFAVSHLPAAVNIRKAADVHYPKDTQIIAYCSVGVRSADFSEQLDKLGFTNILNLRGSIFAWGNKGYTLVRGSKIVSVVHPYNKKWGKLLNRELHSHRVDSEQQERP